MSKAIELAANKRNFRRKLEVLEPVVVSDVEYTLSDADFGSMIILDQDLQTVKLINFVPSNSGHIRIITSRNTQPGDLQILSIELAAYDLDNFEDFAVTSAITLSRPKFNGVDLYYDKPGNKWYIVRIVSNKLSGIIAEVDGGESDTGEIGEIIVGNTSGTQVMADSVATVVGSVNLTAGVWELSGWAEITGTLLTSTYRRVYIKETSEIGFSNGAAVDNHITTQSSVVNLIPAIKIVNITELKTYEIIAYAEFTAGSVVADGEIVARRIK